MRQAEIVVGLVERQLLSQAILPFAQRHDAPADRRHMVADAEVDPVAVGGRITPPTAVPKRSVPVSVHSAPQSLDACHAYPAGDSLGVPAFSPGGSAHGALAGSQSANHGGYH